MVCPLFGNQLFFLTGRSFLAFPIGKIHFSCVTQCLLLVFTSDFQIDFIFSSESGEDNAIAVYTSTAWNKNCEKDTWRARNDFNTTHSAQPDTVKTRGILKAHGTECFQFARGVDYSRVCVFRLVWVSYPRCQHQHCIPNDETVLSVVNFIQESEVRISSH